MKDITFEEIVKRLNKTFPEYDIASIRIVHIKDRLDRIPIRQAWEILISRNIE